MTTKIGTGPYMAPYDIIVVSFSLFSEIVLGEFYDEKIDVFSFGIILFVLISEVNKIYDCMNPEMRVARVSEQCSTILFVFRIHSIVPSFQKTLFSFLITNPLSK